jgi:glycosyltransferase involved in cell wall biosynthesis
MNQKKREPIRLSVAIGSLDRGGAERHLLQVLPHFQKYGFTVDVFCFSHKGVLSADMERLGVRVIGPLVRPRFGGAPSVVIFAFSALRFMIYLLRRRPHIVHFFLPVSYIFGAPVAVVTRCYIRVMSRRNQNNYQRYSYWIGVVERLWHRRMSAVLGNSLSVVRQLREEGVPDSKLNLIYNGVDFAAFGQSISRQAARRRLGLSDDALVFVIVANLIHYKGHADLLQAFAGIKEKLPQNWILLCAGRDDGIGSSLQNSVEELGLSQRIHWLGSVKNVPSLLAAADIALLTSHEEGFSNAILEYMAAGLPTIATDVGGNAEAVLHERNGLVVPARDSAALGAAILRLVMNPAQRKEFGTAAQTAARQHYSIDACVAGYIDLYGKLLREHGMA